MPPLPEVQRPDHLMPSAHQTPYVYRPAFDPVPGDDLSDCDTEEDQTLAEITRGKEGKPLPGGGSPPGSDPFAGHSKGQRTTARKRKAPASSSGGGDGSR